MKYANVCLIAARCNNNNNRGEQQQQQQQLQVQLQFKEMFSPTEIGISP